MEARSDIVPQIVRYIRFLEGNHLLFFFVVFSFKFEFISLKESATCRVRLVLKFEFVRSRSFFGESLS